MSDELTIWQRIFIKAINLIVCGGISALGLTMMYWLTKLMIRGNCR